ncbi:putative membrane associated protein [Borrelia duttonii CR2A]|uniref:Putative membrane associated protein n=1 Tax=Borrelia duttonii CR2A TaxID=1432657 RepID=W6THP4_9SPIR|nr:hypothetical protein [Borrelia duttonii]ETZ18013.1 putative membrane associated protein [Borrelia duttonii CR2A]
MRRNNILLAVILMLFIGCDLDSGIGLLRGVLDKLDGKSISSDGMIDFKNDDINVINEKDKGNLVKREGLVPNVEELVPNVEGLLPNVVEEKYLEPGDIDINDIDNIDVDKINDYTYPWDSSPKSFRILLKKLEKAQQRVQYAYDIWDKACSARNVAYELCSKALAALNEFVKAKGENSIDYSDNKYFELTKEVDRKWDDYQKAAEEEKRTREDVKKADDYCLKLEATIEVLMSPFMPEKQKSQDSSPELQSEQSEELSEEQPES